MIYGLDKGGKRGRGQDLKEGSDMMQGWNDKRGRKGGTV